MHQVPSIRWFSVKYIYSVSVASAKSSWIFKNHSDYIVSLPPLYWSSKLKRYPRIIKRLLILNYEFTPCTARNHGSDATNHQLIRSSYYFMVLESTSVTRHRLLRKVFRVIGRTFSPNIDRDWNVAVMLHINIILFVKTISYCLKIRTK